MTTPEVTVEFNLSCPGWSLASRDPMVLPVVSSTEELRSIVNGLLSEGHPRDDWLFRAGGSRIVSSIIDTTLTLPKFNTETTLKIDVLIPVGVEFEASMETPDALIKIVEEDGKLVCLGSRGNVSVFDKCACDRPPTILHSDEPNAVDILPIVHNASEGVAKSYWQITACGVVSSVNIGNKTIDIEGKIDVSERITAAAMCSDQSLLILGDSKGSVFFYSNPRSRKRPLESSNTGLESFSWMCSRPTLSKLQCFRQPVCHIDLRENEQGFVAVIASLDGTIKVLDTIDGEILNVFHTGSTITAYTRQDPNIIVTGHVDGRCKLWHHSDISVNGAGRLSCITTSQIHDRAITDVALIQGWFGRDHLITAGNDRCICISDANDGHVEQRFDLLPGTSADARQHALIPDVGPFGDYGVFPTALLVDSDAFFVGTNNNRVHRIILKK